MGLNGFKMSFKITETFESHIFKIYTHVLSTNFNKKTSSNLISDLIIL